MVFTIELGLKFTHPLEIHVPSLTHFLSTGSSHNNTKCSDKELAKVDISSVNRPVSLVMKGESLELELCYLLYRKVHLFKKKRNNVKNALLIHPKTGT